MIRTSRRISHQCQTKKPNFQCWWWCWWRQEHISMELVMPDGLTQKLSPTKCFKFGTWYGMYHSAEKQAEAWRFNLRYQFKKAEQIRELKNAKRSVDWLREGSRKPTAPAISSLSFPVLGETLEAPFPRYYQFLSWDNIQKPMILNHQEVSL